MAYNFYVLSGVVIWVDTRALEVLLGIFGEDAKGACHGPVCFRVVVEFALFRRGGEVSP